MASEYESFWNHGSFAVVGHAGKRNFPQITYRALKRLGKKAFPVDPSVGEIDGDRTCPDLASLPEPVEAVVLEVPKEDARDWVAAAAAAGIRDIWIHMGRDTPEALALGREKGLHVLSGTCAVMYLDPGFTYHAIHKGLMKLLRRY